MTYVGSEDVVINETTCDAAAAGTTTVTLTNSNGCEYTETTIVTYVGSEDVVIGAKRLAMPSVEQQQLL
ncbi:MAG: hypothetical protein R2753_11885 [Chitinophagales bacterium]